MNPGATTRPAASIVRVAGPLNLPISAILPSLTPTSPRNAGIPEPSTMRPFLISRSYAIATPFLFGSPFQILAWEYSIRWGGVARHEFDGMLCPSRMAEGHGEGAFPGAAGLKPPAS